MRATIEIYLNCHWIQAADINLMGRGPYTATFEYRLDYVFGDATPMPVSLTLPVNAQRQGAGAEGVPGCPPFLLDLVPQGRGRQYLLQALGLTDDDGSDLPLALHGAFNPVGNLRLDTAVEFYRQHAMPPEEGFQGFSLSSIMQRSDAFLNHIWTHALLASGTTGLQGAAPKFLLTKDRQDLWYADMALADSDAAEHWLVKLTRGQHESDKTILRNEAAYLRVADLCGLRVKQGAMWHGDMLFVPRFDRQVYPEGLQRLHQESLASLAGLRGFGLPVSMFGLVEAFHSVVTNPVTEVVEFLKRDVLNLAMRNTDNHARNTAVQRLPDGQVQLTPLYDFAPMYMDRELIVRSVRWRLHQGRELTAWEEIVGQLAFTDAEKKTILKALKEFARVVQRLPEVMQDCGVDPQIIGDCQLAIEEQVRRLEAVQVDCWNDKEREDGPAL